MQFIDEKDFEEKDWDDFNETEEKHKINWKLISGVVGVFLLGILFFLFKDITSLRLLIIRANDVSDSGMEHIEAQLDHCKTNQRLQKVGDVSVTIEFADKAEIVNERKIENALDFTPCDFKTNSGVGRQPGTSLLNVFRLVDKTVKGYRNRGIDYPLVLTITVDAVEPVKGQLPFSDDTVKEIASIASELTNDGKGKIVIIGPSAINSLQEKLKTLEADINLRVCPFSNTKSCTEEAIKNARKS